MKKIQRKIVLILLTLVSVRSLYAMTARANGDSNEVDVIDSVVITELYDTNKVLAEWSVLDPEITVHRAFESAEAVKLFLNWSDRGGAVDLRGGDHFTFVIPSVFNHNRIADINDKAITDKSGEVVATYSVYTNAQGVKEIKVTFTEFVDTHTDLSGDLWLILYVGDFKWTETKNLEFILNGEVAASGEATVNPGETANLAHPVSVKYGYSSPANAQNGYYIFEWNILLNAEENSTGTGFSTLADYSFEDLIQSDSPHVFITGELSSEFNIPSRYQTITVKEYTGSDLEPPEERYGTFLKRYYYIGGDPWVSYLSNRTLADGVKSIGIDGGNGLDIAEVKITDKIISAKLGTLTRPTLIHYYTMATIKISEGSLGDSETVKFFNNTFIGNSGEALTANLSEYYFASGGSAQGLLGDYRFTFTKVSESDTALAGVWFSLSADEDFTGGADRVAVSGSDGVVAFDNLAEGIYYFRETAAPAGYVLDDNIYKVEIGGQGYGISYGGQFENKLSDRGNRIVNREEAGNNGPAPVHAALTGTKILSGKTLEDRMFVFAVRDANGNIVGTGRNDADGTIHFDPLEYAAQGSYRYTVEEVRGNADEIGYSDAVYTVTVIVSGNSDGTLMATVAYPDGGIVFRNTYTERNEPGTEIPGTEIPGAEIPGTVIPGTKLPGTAIPGTTIPETEIPEAEMPVKEIPETEIPLAEMPDGNPSMGGDIAGAWMILLAAASGVGSMMLRTDIYAGNNRRAK